MVILVGMIEGLYSAGSYADSVQAVKEPCEFFYELLNIYEHAEFDAALEQQQRAAIYDEFKEEISGITPLYERFKGCFRRYIQQRA